MYTAILILIALVLLLAVIGFLKMGGIFSSFLAGQYLEDFFEIVGKIFKEVIGE